jgi:pyruvate/2-oxoglutarate dehydrogenase complex dihydrolipoamide dehydrogenase (E3) component
MRHISRLLWIQVIANSPFANKKRRHVKHYPDASPAEDFDRVIGIHMVAPSASEAIQGFALAMKKGLFKRDLDTIVGVHPTVTEALMNGNLEIAKSSGKDPKSKGC